MDVSGGGERKMLAITNVMIRRPKLVIFDEPSLGLSPIMISQIQDAILKIKDRGISAIIAEQNIGWLKPLADQAYLLDLGQIVARGTLSDLSRSDLIANAYLGPEVRSGETRELAISSYR
jgi:branched-chain amino acid transport system ATP-binding protein